MNTVNTANNTSFYKQPTKIPFKLRLIQSYIKILSYTWPAKGVNFLVKLFSHPRTNRSDILRKYADSGIFEFGIQKMVLFDQTEIFTYQEQQPQVLLVPGWESSALRFVTIMEELRKQEIGFLYFDLPGQGKSGGNSNNAIKTSKIIHCLLELYPSINSIVGHSFGGGSSFLALSKHIYGESTPKQIKRLITVGSPTQYKSIINPFLTFLNVPRHMEPRFIQGLSDHVGNDFSKYNLLEMNIQLETELILFHDKNDETIPVDDAERMRGKYILNMTQGLGHRKIMHDEVVTKEIGNLVKNTMIEV